MCSSISARGRNRPAVSVILPCYNYGHLIGATIQSLQTQTFTNWECVVVDDGSNDNTIDVVEGFAYTDNRIKVVRQENGGLAAARNTGLWQITGRYVQFLDADDLLEPLKFERQVEYLEKHTDVDILYGASLFFRTDRPQELLHAMEGDDIRSWPKLSGKGSRILLPLVYRNNLLVCAPLARRALIQRVGFFSRDIVGVEDWEFWIRCGLAGAHFRYEEFEKTRALVRSHASMSKNRLAMLDSSVRLRRKLIRLLANDSHALRVNAQLLGEAEGILGAQEVISGERTRGVYHLTRAFVFDRKFRHRLKWLICALAALLVGRKRFAQIYASSISSTIMRSLKLNRTIEGCLF